MLLGKVTLLDVVSTKFRIRVELSLRPTTLTWGGNRVRGLCGVVQRDLPDHSTSEAHRRRRSIFSSLSHERYEDDHLVASGLYDKPLPVGHRPHDQAIHESIQFGKDIVDGTYSNLTPP